MEGTENECAVSSTFLVDHCQLSSSDFISFEKAQAVSAVCTAMVFDRSRDGITSNMPTAYRLVFQAVRDSGVFERAVCSSDSIYSVDSFSSYQHCVKNE